MPGSNDWLSWLWRRLTCPKTHILLEIPSANLNEAVPDAAQNRKQLPGRYPRFAASKKHAPQELKNGEAANNSEANLVHNRQKKSKFLDWAAGYRS